MKVPNLKFAIINAQQELFRHGETRPAGRWQAVSQFRQENMIVLRNFSFISPVPHIPLTLQGLVKADQPWAEDHFQERISGQPLNPGDTYKVWPYNTFKKENDPYLRGKEFSHTYMERFWPKRSGHQEGLLKGIRYHYGDLDDVIKLLNNEPLTRQAYLPIFFPEDTGATEGQRVPCTLGYLFEIWDDKIDCTYYIRSCDLLRHFQNDIYLTVRLMQHVASATDFVPGNLTVHIANLHLFENDKYAFKKKLKADENK